MNPMTKIPVFFGILFIALFSSCTAPVSSPVKVQQQPLVYKSGDYAVCRLDEKTSLTDLARIYLKDERLVWKIEDANDTGTFQGNSMVIIPLKEKNRGGIFEDGYQRIPILCYHRFETGELSSMNTPPQIFDQQMNYLKENGYRVISADDLLNFLTYQRQVPKKSVLITIDDGYRSAYQSAWPILKKYGFTATLFVYTSYVGISSKAITWDQLRTLKSSGFTIGSHSIYHSDLTSQKDDESDEAFHRRLEKEIFQSKKIIDRELAQDTFFFAFPYGRYNAQILEMTASAGYKMAVSVDQGSNPFFTNPLALKRDMVLKKDLDSFVSKLKTFTQLSLR
jgi:peptidoglycan/xylan/chitin deacetylase (PgdA/CDA1 family)